jgi:CRP-like cAMP-binding protein
VTVDEGKNVRRSLQQGAWFRRLPRPLRDAIVARSVPRTYAKGDVITAQGAPAAGLSAVLEGRVGWTRSTGSGGGVLLYIAGPGTWFGHLALLRGTPSQFNVVARSDVRILLLPRAACHRLIEEDPSYARWIADHALERLEVLLQVYAASRSLPAEAFVPAALATLAGLRQSESAAGEATDLALTQAEVAAMLGVSRQTLNAALMRLQAAGLIEVGFGRVRIPDPVRLHAAGLEAPRRRAPPERSEGRGGLRDDARVASRSRRPAGR